eukprot:3576298-Pleurochrysis_carterae.AAC.3
MRSTGRRVEEKRKRREKEGGRKSERRRREEHDEDAGMGIRRADWNGENHERGRRQMCRKRCVDESRGGEED